ncbi:hypothetical protein [Nocardioides lijunqiniae]|uniref:hypothetical protein n=1 Tax=Nocardioides lijunqiniae TaxID=2760832 RepID=UPI0018782DBE|nr:hypothetical protein [Nocardioides lijunqiniae]
MSLRRAAAAAVLSTALASTAVLAPVAAASADAPSERAGKACVSKKEYRKLKKGMTIAKVKRITGTNGKQVNKYPLPGGKFVVGRAYKACTKRGAVGISFTNQTGPYKLAAKSAAWR